MMPDAEFDEALTWREAGVDSLKSLHFLLRLEQLMGRRLSFDMITRDMTIGDLIGVLSTHNEDDQTQDTQSETVFLIPGLFGDEPILAEFRRSLAGRVKFDTLTLPDIDRPTRVLASLKATAALLVDDIVERQPEGPLYLAGYSLGGLLAFEAARQLGRLGREVRLVCLIDALMGSKGADKETGQDRDPVRADSEREPSAFRLRDGETVGRYAERFVFGALMRLNLIEAARRWALATSKHNDLLVNARRRRHLLDRMRRQAIFLWRPRHCDTPVLLIASDDFARYCKLTVWSDLCSNYAVQRVPGGHRDVFEPDSLAVLNPALLAALDSARLSARIAS
jgi:thioesterase domain-containing protein